MDAAADGAAARGSRSRSASSTARSTWSVRDSGAGVAAGHGARGLPRAASPPRTAARRPPGARHRPVAGAPGVHPPRRRRRRVTRRRRAFTATLPGRPEQLVGLVIGVLIVDDDFMVAKVHAGFVARAATASRWSARRRPGAQALAEVERLAARPGAARRLPARHDRPGGAAAAARGRVDGRRHRHQRGAGRRQHPQRPARRRPALPGQAVRPAHLRGAAAGLRRSARRAGRARRAPARATSTGCSALAAGGASPAARPKGITPETLELVRAALARPAPTGCRPPSAASAPGWRASARGATSSSWSRQQADVRQRYGTAGRPERRYRVR